MAICKSCGTDAGESKFCPGCGMSQLDVIAKPVESMGASSDQSFTPLQGGSPMGDTQGQSTSQQPVANTVPYYSAQNSEVKPNRSGQMIFSVVNIVIGAIFCCCGGSGFITMVLGIIAAVISSQVDSTPNAEEANKKLNTAKILNIVAVVVLVLAVIGSVIIFLTFPNLRSWNYYYQYTK